ncbi:uncharacterized protein DUF3574 [Chitinophaga skermanii]|uniref:Uncharacterized protein DUF3574 n=1 Tax=Chitinophaga skermanii TaxID=331697 RepID=A0A327QQK2_9BACT|nr:DUF3574 domain-containing protein [Chitinophaga skermanii]RAJ06531.1 uncharacterized protein DUF3574 [Chitinophaga skermanii]
MKIVCLLVFSSVILLSCATTQRTDLYFGRNIPTGGQVSNEQWQHFSDSIITHFFPEGYTESDAVGKWQDTKTQVTIAEPTKVVTFVGAKSAKRNKALDSIATAYMKMFAQQAVLRVNAKITMKFVSQ